MITRLRLRPSRLPLPLPLPLPLLRPAPARSLPPTLALIRHRSTAHPSLALLAPRTALGTRNSGAWNGRVPMQRPEGSRGFQTSSRRELPAPAVLLAAAAVLKSSAGVTIATTVTRTLLTLLPISLMGRKRMSSVLRKFIKSSSVSDPCPIATAFYADFCVGEKWGMAPHVHSRKDTDEKRRLRFEAQTQCLYATEIPLEYHADLINLDPHMFRALGYFHLPALSPTASLHVQQLTVQQRIALYKIRMFEAEKSVYEGKIRGIGWFMQALIAIPAVLIGLALLFSLERVPYTGRWRTIMLSPQEEDALSSTLAGPGWYTAVISQLTTATSPSPPIVPMDDWRWQWVNAVMRTLERGVVEQVEAIRMGRGEEHAEELIRKLSESASATVAGRDGEFLYPAPSRYPLQPRPRAASTLHSSLPGGTAGSGQEHLSFGPPYSLLLLEKDERNAMSYGFGPGGSGGIVVFTGMLDEILSSPTPPLLIPDELPPTPAEPQSTLSSLFSIFRQSPPPPRPQPARPPQPTEEQTLRLAAVLSHELAHLLLSHHLEHVSVADVMIPSVASLVGDLARTLIFPFTMIFGPFVNDAIANASKTWVGEARFCEDGMNAQHEIEADIVGLRVLAYAGYNPRAAVSSLHSLASSPCPDTFGAPLVPSDRERPLWYNLRGSSHLTQEKRLEILDEELDRWAVVWRTRLEKEKLAAERAAAA